jgi:triosephosphate isomerase
MAGTGWKMNVRASEVPAYAERLLQQIGAVDTSAIDLFVLPPFTSLGAAAAAFGGTPVAIGGQNMHWEEHGAWTGEISAAMLVDSGCRYVELAHSERLQHFGESYERVRSKVDRALAAGLTPIVCLGETAEDRRHGGSDEVLARQLATALAGQPARRIPDVVLAYEPRWAIGGSEAASPEYVQARHATLRALLCDRFDAEVACRTRILYGGSVTPDNGPGLVALGDVDGLFVGRAAWNPEGFARIVTEVVEAARAKAGRPGG